MKRTPIIILAVALLAATPSLATDTTRWLNVNVTEPHGGTNVEVHLPLSLVLAVLQSVDVEHFHSGKVDLEIHDADIDWPQLLSAIKEAPDGDFVKVDADDANVRVSKNGGTLTIDVTETGEEGDHAMVKVTVPDTIIDALSIDEENRIDLAVLLQSFDSLPDGDLVTVDADDAKVRVWIE